MRKKILALCLVMGMCLMSTACGTDEKKTSETESTVATIELTTPAQDESSSEVVEPTTEKPSEESSEEITTEEATTEKPTEETTTEKPTEETTTEEPTTEETTTEAKVYDVYVNGKGYDKGTTVKFKVSLKANDTEFSICCPSFNVAYEGSTSGDEIYEFIEIDTDDCNPLLVSNQGDVDGENEYLSYWEYYTVLDMWDNPDGKPLDITGGIYVYTVSVKFNEAGKYNISVTSGNGYEDMADEFAKYDNCFTYEIIE